MLDIEMAMRAIYPSVRCVRNRSIPIVISEQQGQVGRGNLQAMNRYVPCAAFSRWWPRPIYTDWVTPFRHELDDFPHFMLREISKRNHFGDEWRKMLKEFYRIPSEMQQLEVEKLDGTITEKDGKFSYDMHLEGFEPADIKVKTVGQKVVIEATKETNTEEQGLKSYSKKNFHHSIVLPENVKPDDLTSTLSSKGVLRISAPVMSLPEAEEKEIEVESEKTENETKHDNAEKSS